MTKKVVKKHSKPTRSNKTPKSWRIVWWSIGIAAVLTILTSSYVYFFRQTHVLGAEIAMVYGGDGGGGGCTARFIDHAFCCSSFGKYHKCQNYQNSDCSVKLKDLGYSSSCKPIPTPTPTPVLCPSNYNRIVCNYNEFPKCSSTPGLGLNTVGSNSSKCSPVNPTNAKPKNANTCIVAIANSSKCQSGYGSYGFFTKFGTEDQVGESCTPNPAYAHTNTIINCPNPIQFQVKVVDQQSSPVVGVIINAQVNDRKYSVKTGSDGIALIKKVYSGDFVTIQASADRYMFKENEIDTEANNNSSPTWGPYGDQKVYGLNCGSVNINEQPCTFHATRLSSF